MGEITEWRYPVPNEYPGTQVRSDLVPVYFNPTNRGYPGYPGYPWRYFNEARYE